LIAEVDAGHRECKLGCVDPGQAHRLRTVTCAVRN
jgi:hypothetical protein